MPTDSGSSTLQRWLADRSFLLEVFVFSNLAFLILDVSVAHAVNDFAHPAEWIPVGFAVVGSLALGLAVFFRVRGVPSMLRWVGEGVGWIGVLVGVAGLVWHLEGQFFQVLTLDRLVYSAPFVAPLAFAGLGLLLLMNRRVPSEHLAWGRWVLFLAWGGFIGNFALSLADHAQNGFFYATEWIPVIASALAVGYFFALIIRPAQSGFIQLGYWILGLQVAVGIVGFGFHIAPLFQPADDPLIYRIIFGAPVFAPLLFIDLALLAALGLWDVQTKVETRTLAGA